MTRIGRLAALGTLALLLMPTAALAQYPSELVGFNGDPPEEPIGDPATSQEMFKIPEWSGSTTNYVVHNTSGTYDQNSAYRATGLHTEGAAAMEVIFHWADEQCDDPDAWMRLTTFNGPGRPNPSLHTLGKVRFDLTNRSELFNGEIGLCIGIRETGVEVPQMNDGGTSGEIEWVGVDTTPNGIIAGADMIVDTTAAGDDVQVYDVGTDIGPDGLDLPTGTAIVDPGLNGVLDTAATGDDEVRFGYFIGADGGRVPIPAITLPPSSNEYLLEWDLTTGQVTINGGAAVGGITGMTGNGSFDVTPNRGTLEHIAFTPVTCGPQRLIDVGIDRLQFEAPEQDPVLPPTVVAPIIYEDTEVYVTDLLLDANRVTLYVDGGEVDHQDLTDPVPDTVTFTIVGGAQSGDIYTATQRQDITGIVSDPSEPVVVFPAPSPYSFSFVLDEDGDICGYGAGGWERVPVTSVSGSIPQGMALFNQDGVWQTINVDLMNSDFVIPWLGGNGEILPAGSGLFGIDSLWFTVAPGATSEGPHEIFIDAVEALDEFDNVIGTIHTMEDGLSYMTYIRGQSTTSLTSSTLRDDASFDGEWSQRMTWTYPTVGPAETLAIHHSLGGACVYSPTFPDTTATVRLRMLCRNASDNPVPLPEVVGPIIYGQDTIRVLNDETATALQVYINGFSVGGPVTPTGTQTDIGGLTLATDDSVSVVQTLPAGDSDLAYPRGVATQPLPPTVTAPVLPGATTVEVSRVYQAPYASASLVTVLVDGIARGSVTDPASDTIVVDIDGDPLEAGSVITAQQMVNGSLSGPSAAVMINYPAPVMYKAPAAGEATVTVLGVHTDADLVTVIVNDTDIFTVVPDEGADRADVPVSGLVQGDTVVAEFSAGAVSSLISESETVTVGTVVEVILNDHFEYDQITYEATWVDSDKPRLTLSEERNATYPTGLKSLYAGPGNERVQQDIANIIPTEEQPVIWNVNIYDGYGPGASNVQFAQLNGQNADTWYQHVGMLSWAPQNTNYYQYRAYGNSGPNWLDLDQYDGPTRSIGWHTFTIVHKGYFVDVYVDGLLSAKNIALASQTTMDRARIGPGYTSVNDAFYDDFMVEVGPVRFEPIGSQPPSKPLITAPIIDGDEAVTVQRVDVDATSVTIYDESMTNIGQYTGPVDESRIVEVTLTRPLVHLEAITATVVNAFGSETSDALEVGNYNGDVLICIGIRETGDTGPLGSTGGTSGSIEWIGASGETLGGAPIGVAVSPSDDWQTLVFDPIAGPNYGFTGDGIIDGDFGTLEHLAVAVNSTSPNRSSGPYALYVDNVINVEADGGVDFLITDFEGYAPGDEVLLQEPTNSGSTSGHIAPLPSASEVTGSYGNPGQSEWLVWFFVDTADSRWIRITTSATTFMSRPIIDLSKPIQLDVLLVTEQGGPVLCPGDLDCSGAIDFDDIDPFVLALGGQPGYEAQYPNCQWLNADCNEDGNVDFDDIDAFVTLIGTSCP